jgi:RNA polymerase sigma-70 factor (ECF subfamily)
MAPRRPDETSPNVPLCERSDEDLVRLHRGGQDDAFAELVKRYEGELFHFLVRFTNSRATADDLFQETFVQVHISADSFDVSKRFKPWLFTIAANKARDYLRKHRRQQTMTLSATVDGDPQSTSFIDLLRDDLPMPDERTADEEVRALVRDAVTELPDHLREVLLLAYFQRLAYKEVAEVLGVPLGTVKSRLHAAVGAFTELWKRKFPGVVGSADGSQDFRGGEPSDG